jgi:DNA end-binding protein Ku
MRALATRTIAFGLVSIPVKMYSTSDTSESVSFRMLHDKCGSRLRQQYICTKDEEIVDRAHTVKGFEFAKDQYVIFSDEEIKAVEAKVTEEIEIAEFVPLSAVDPVYFDKVYYLGPDKGGDRAYKLLSEALRRSQLVAVARYTARGKQYLVMIRPNEQGGLILQQLRYADEVRGFQDVPVKEGVEVKEAELQLALQLIQASASESFSAEKYEDQVRHELQAAIEQKIAGQQITIAPAEEPKARVIDLMEALKASLNLTGGGADGDGERKPAQKAAKGEEVEEMGG